MNLSTRTLAVLAALPLLTGCVQDTASYLIDDDRNHAITVARAQNWFWTGEVDVSVIAARQPDCLGGLDVRDVPRAAEMVLHRGPDEYPEPIFILAIEGIHYAVSTQSCRVQKFARPPADPGPVIGRYRETEGRFQFVPAAK